jgi:epoxyqueuosine reductase
VLTSEAVKSQALSLGFDLCGIAAAGPCAELQVLPGWLKSGYAGRMTYLNRTARVRADVRQWLPSARSVICVACVYHTDRPLSVELADPNVARIARYAWGDDYHTVLRRRLESLLAWMVERSDVPFTARIGVDDVPVQERVFAAHAGLGWIGKNTCLISPELGSWLVLGEVATSLDLDPDPPVFDQCGTCRLCLDACPTHALVEPHVLDARRCLSYLTIEIRHTIPEGQRHDLGSHVFGCDTCQDVCPHNAGAHPASDPAWWPRAGLDQPRLADLWRAGDEALGLLAEGSALSRRGVAGLRRNVAVALGNRGTAEAARVLSEPLAESPAVAGSVVAEHVAWALAQCPGRTAHE